MTLLSQALTSADPTPLHLAFGVTDKLVNMGRSVVRLVRRMVHHLRVEFQDFLDTEVLVEHMTCAISVIVTGCWS